MSVGLRRRRASSSFESGGRSYGRCGSAPIATMRPSKPSRRSVSAARSPASDVPTTADRPHSPSNLPTGRKPDVAVILTAARPPPSWSSSHAQVASRPLRRRPHADAADVDVSGRAAAPARRRPRHVPAPEDDRGHRRVGAVGEAEHRDDAQVRRVGARSTAPTFYPGAPRVRDGARAPVLQVDLRRPRRPRPRDHPHRPRGRHLRRGAAAQGQVRGDLRGRLLRDRRGGREARAAPRRARARRGDVRLLGPNTNLNAFEDFRADLDGPSIALITQSGHQGRPVFQGQEIGIRLTHWAPTGNEVDLEFADFARYFADQPEVGVIACYIEGFKDGRTLMLAADHAAQLRKPIVMVKVGKTDGRPLDGAVAHRPPHRLRRGHDRGVPPVRRDARRRPRRAARSLGRVRAHAARRRSRRGRRRRSGPGVCVYAISGGTGAHMADMLADAGPAAPRPHEGDAGRRCTTGSSPRTCACRTRSTAAARRSPTARGREILDAILADKNVDILVVPITGAVVMFSEPFTRDVIDAAKTTTKPIFVVWGAPSGTDDTYYKRLLDGGLPDVPHVRQLRRGGEGLRRLLDVRGALPLAVRRRADRRRLPAAKKARKLLDGLAAGRGAVGVAARSSCSRRTASRRRRTSCARRRPRR